MEVEDESQVEQPPQYSDEQIEFRALSMIAMAMEAVRESIDKKNFYANLHSIEFELEDGLDRAAAGWLLKNRKQEVKVGWNTLTFHLMQWKEEEE